MFSGVINQALLSGIMENDSGLEDARKTLPIEIHSAIGDVWRKGNNGLGLFLFGLNSLAPVKGNVTQQHMKTL